MRRALLSLPFVLAASMVALPVLDVSAESINAGGRKAEASAPFTATSVAEFDTPGYRLSARWQTFIDGEGRQDFHRHAIG